MAVLFPAPSPAPGAAWRSAALRQWLSAAALSAAAVVVLATAPQAAEAQVGLSSLVVDGQPVTLVYPTAQTARPVVRGPFTLTVAPDAPPLPGVRRLVVMSHGTGGSPLTDHDLASTLARAGFVVAQPRHRGDNVDDRSDAGPTSFARRPLEVSRVIDALAGDAAWQGRLALDRVGVHGMSAGGVTALSLAGAQWRVLDLIRHCQTHADDDAGFCFNGLTDPQALAARKASYERARNVPEVFLPAELTVVHGGKSPTNDALDVRPDPRIASASVSVPVAALFTAESLARIRIPVGVVSAGADRMLRPVHHAERVLRECTACTLLMNLPNAAHMDLLSPWPASVAAETARRLTGAEPAAGFDPRQRDEAFARIAAFHRKVLGQ